MSGSTGSAASNSNRPFEHLAERVRQASREGQLIALEDLWQGSEMEFIAWKQAQGTGADDMMLIRSEERVYLYSELHMTFSYAKTIARAGSKDICRAIVETVREESASYPRPTSLKSFREPPFTFSCESLRQACEAISLNPEYRDIRQINASDGSTFLFSCIYLAPEHAQSMAEWLAVGHLQNP